MTAQLEHRFDCDRCGCAIHVPHQSKPVTQQGPTGWSAVLIDGDQALHLCGDCSSAFRAFLDDRPSPSMVDRADLVLEGR